MLSVLSVVIYALIVLISVILVVLILVQPSKGGGLGSAFGGAGENVFGAHAMEHVSKLTVWLISIFFVLALSLTVISAHASRSDSSVVSAAVAGQEKKADAAAPAAAAVEQKAADAVKTATETAAPAVNAAAEKKAEK